MKEIFSISSGVDVAVAKIKPTAKESKESADKGTPKDFLSVMFAQIKESIVASKEDTKLSLKIAEKTEDIKIDLPLEGEKKSVDKHPLENLLKITSLLKNPDIKNISFPSVSNNLEKLLNSETALKELKDINNISDLLKLSKKYDLGLEKISIKSIDLPALKKEFPLLAKKDFFVIPKEDSPKSIATTTKEVELKPTVLTVNNIEKPKADIKKELTLFEKIMSSPKDEKKEGVVQVIREKVVVDEKKENLAVKMSEEVKKTINIVQEEAPKIVVKENQKEAKATLPIDELHVKVASEIKNPEVTKPNEIKNEPVVVKKGLIESILQGIKAPKQGPAVLTQETAKAQTITVATTTAENSETKLEPIINKNDLKPQLKIDTIASKQLSPTRETFSSFAADFKAKIDSYKPPFMKIQLALNPKGLGEVDVTIVNRGNNLHVNITSNTNTMSVFVQNQAEFKNSLVNMGFTNLEMNFSDQKEKQQENGKNSKNHSDFFEEESLEDETASIELVVPKYI